MVKACATAGVGWLADLTSSAWADYHPREGISPEPEEKCLTTDIDAGRLRDMLRARIVAAAADNTLANHRDLSFLLFTWSDLAGDDGAEARIWTARLYASDEGVKLLAKAFTSYGWSQGLGFAGLGDVVAKRTTRVRMKGMEKFVGLGAFRQRVEEVAAKGASAEVSEFLEAWRRSDRGERD